MQNTVLPHTPPSETPRIGPFRKRFQRAANPYAPLLVLNAKGSIEHLSSSAARLLEYDGEASIDPCFFAHVHGKNLYQVMRDVADMVCYGKAQASWLFRLRTGKGRWRWYKATATNSLDGEDEAGITIRLRDLQGW